MFALKSSSDLENKCNIVYLKHIQGSDATASATATTTITENVAATATTDATASTSAVKKTWIFKSFSRKA